MFVFYIISDHTDVSIIQHATSNVDTCTHYAYLFFVNVGPSLSKELLESQNNYVDYLQYSTQNAFTFDEVSENDTLKLLCSLKESKSTGPDKINARLVKDSAEVICPTIMEIN